jgi:palmitoyltransferase ZDHHC9/14/18
MCCGGRKRKKHDYDPDLPVLRADVWPARHIPIFNGSMLLGPDRITYAITFFLLGLPAIFFIAFTCADIFRYVHWSAGVIILLLGLTLFFANIYCLVKVGTMDPGILPKNVECYREFFAESQTLATEETAAPIEGRFQTANRITELPQAKIVEVNGENLEMKYCRTCKIFRPPRASHCSRCDCCVDRFDHHCPWTGTCIGRRNHRYFYFFVTLTFLLCVYTTASCLLQIGMLISICMKPAVDGSTAPYHDLDFGQAIFTSISLSPVSFIMLLYGGVMGLSVCGLSFYHCYLIGINQTTYEQINNRYKRRRNPYEKSAWNNFKEVLFGPIEPSLIHLDQKIIFSEMVEEERIRKEHDHDEIIQIDEDSDELT